MSRLVTFRTFLIAFFLFACGLQMASRVLGNSPDLIVGDGKGYYVWVRSLVIDGDFDFRNDYELLYVHDPLPPEYDRPTPVRSASNKYPVGLPLIEAPAVLVAHAIALLVPSIPADGVSAPYQILVPVWLIALCVLGLACLRAAMIREGVPPALASVLVAGMIVSTNLLHYVAKEPTMAHAAGVGVLGVLLGVMTGGNRSTPWRWTRFLGIGLLIGLLLLVRNSNVALLPFLGTLLVLRGGRTRSLWWVGLGAGVVLALQPWTLHELWGSVQATTYPGEGFTGGPQGLWAGLVHARHGLFVYHPAYLLLIAIIVPALRTRRTRPLTTAAALSFLAFVIVNGNWWCWWFGDAFGNRAYIEALPMLVLVAGIALSAGAADARDTAADDSRRRRALTATLVLGAANLWLWAGFLTGQFPADGSHSLAQAWLWIVFG